jgi:hypothetical protein
MALIYVLHPEILSIIFENAKIMTDQISLAHKSSNGTNRNMAFEITASRTCSYFRVVALATPQLWTTIHIHGAARLECIVEMLSRSGDCRLDIRIDLGVLDRQMNAEILDPIIDNILLHSRRWRSLCIGYSYERQDRPVVMRLCAVPAPNLQQLSITVNDVAEADGSLVNRTVDLPHIFKEGAPKLGFIRLRGLAIQLFRPPLDNVVTLHLDQIKSVPIQYATLHSILTCSPHLAHLSMYGDILALEGWPDQQKAISLPALRSLRVHSISGEAYAGIMQIINAPKLESLTLKSLQDHDLDPLWSITDKARFDTLKLLSLIECDPSSPTCQILFGMFRQITTFSTMHAARKSNIINILAEGTVKDLNGLQYVPWPRLKTLHLSSDFYDNDQEVIKTMAAVRKEHGYPVSTFMFSASAEETKDMAPLKFESGAGFEIQSCGQYFDWPEHGTHFDHDDMLFQ